MDNYFVEIEETGERYATLTAEDLKRLSEIDLLKLQYDLRGVKSYFHTEYEHVLQVEKDMQLEDRQWPQRMYQRSERGKRIYLALCNLWTLIEKEVELRGGK